MGAEAGAAEAGARTDGAAPEDGAHHAALTLVLRASGTATPHTVEKRITLRSGTQQVEVRWRIANVGDRPIPGIFRLHPALPVRPGDRIDLPACEVTVDPDYSPGLAAGTTRWPWARTTAGERVDLRVVPAGGMLALTATGLADGWCALTDTRQGITTTLRFDPARLDRVALFADFGGWRGLSTVILEPGLGDPTDGGWHRILPGETLEVGVEVEVG